MSNAARIADATAGFRGCMRWMSLIVLSVFLSACALRPIAPELSRAEVLARANPDTNTSVDLDTAKNLLSGWHNVYLEAAQSRRNWQLGFGEVLFYGSVFAVLGAITNHDHLRNLGIAAAGGSSLGSGHYQAAAQLTAFRKAIRRIACMEDAMMQITASDENQFAAELNQKQRTTLYELPAKVVNRIRKVRTELGDTLNGIELATPSKDDIANAFKSWLAAKEGSGTQQVAASRDPNATARMLRKARFTAALDKVDAEIDICMSDGGTS